MDGALWGKGEPMNDLISRKMALECLECLSACDEPFVEIGTDDETFIGKYEAITKLSDLPSAQSEIVRCKDCKYYIPYDWMFDGLTRSSNREDYAPDEIGCSVNDHNYPPDGFCSYAERRTDGVDH